MRPEGHSGVLYTPVDPEPLGGAFPPKQLSAEAAPTDSTSPAAAINRVFLIAVVSSSVGGQEVLLPRWVVSRVSPRSNYRGWAGGAIIRFPRF